MEKSSNLNKAGASAEVRRWYEAAGAAGFVFIRIRRGFNNPPPKGWNRTPFKETQDVSRDPAVALSWLRCKDNVGVGCGPGTCLVDADTARAMQAVAGHVAPGGTLAVGTPRGRQLLFAGERAGTVRQSQGVGAAIDGVDTRQASKGYGMGPGSIRIAASYHKDKKPPPDDTGGPWHYTVAPEGPVAPCDIPRSLVDALFPPRPAKAGTATPKGRRRQRTASKDTIGDPVEHMAGAAPGSIHGRVVAAVTEALNRGGDWVERVREQYLVVSTDDDPAAKFERVLRDQMAFVAANPKRRRRKAPVARFWHAGLPDGLPVSVGSYPHEPTRADVLGLARVGMAGLALLAFPEDGDALEEVSADDADPETCYLQVPNDEDGIDRALAFLGIRVRVNIRAHRALEVCGAIAGPSWIAFADGVDCCLTKEIAKRCRTRHVDKRSNRVYYKPLRITPQVLANWSYANTWSWRCVDPFLEWLDDLPEWDGDERLADLLPTMFELADGQDEDLVAWTGGAPLIAACARALDPGALADTVPGLFGPQGAGKSRFYRDLFPEEVRKQWFSDTLPLDSSEKEWGENFEGKVIVEAGELDGLQRANQERLKARLSRRVLRYRRAYGRAATDFPLRNALVATSNNERPLPNSDSQNRRWLMVRVVRGRAGWEWLDANRVQLWAEAWSRAQAGEDGGLPAALATRQAAHNEPLRDANVDLEDVLSEMVDWILAEPRNTADIVGELARKDCEAAGVEVEQIARLVATAREGVRRGGRAARDVVRAMQAMGFELKPVSFGNNRRVRCWRRKPAMWWDPGKANVITHDHPGQLST